MAKKESKDSREIPVHTEIDKIIHEPARLLIISLLFVVESANFQFLKTQTKLTDGNLSSHLSKLENTGYVNVKKEFVGKKPRTMLTITDEGRKSFIEYRKKMDQFLKGVPK